MNSATLETHKSSFSFNTMSGLAKRTFFQQTTNAHLTKSKTSLARWHPNEQHFITRLTFNFVAIFVELLRNVDSWQRPLRSPRNWCLDHGKFCQTRKRVQLGRRMPSLILCFLCNQDMTFGVGEKLHKQRHQSRIYLSWGQKKVTPTSHNSFPSA